MGGDDKDTDKPTATVAAAADVEVLPARVMLDGTSRWARALDGERAGDAASAPDEDADEDEDPELVGICQICMDVVPKRQVVTRVCGAECLAEVCAQCLVQHVVATVYSFYPGVLPKVRCPICLTLLHKRQWQHFAVPDVKDEDEDKEEEAAASVAPAVATAEGDGADEAASAADHQTDAGSEESDAHEAENAGRESDSTATADSDLSDVTSESDAMADPAEPDPAESEPHSETPESDTAQTPVETPTDTPQQEPQQQADEWVDDNSHVLDKYVVLCRQSCGFQSPCCHNTDYTMLPPVPSRKEAAALVVPLTPQQAAALPGLLSLLRAYCFHREETDVVYDRLTEVFGDEAWGTLALLLPRIVDEERRATLLLHHLFLNPNAVTRCCGEAVCFKCKASDHHDGNCNDFVEEESVLECRGCHVTLVKVDGCDTVACLCGYSFSWQAEVDQRRAQRRQLAPAGDREYAQWLRWHRRLAGSFAKINRIDETIRSVRLARLLRNHRPLLQRVLLLPIMRKRQEQKQRLAADESAAVSPESAVEVAP